MTHIDEFMKALRADVDNFEKYWRAKHKKTPDQWPLEFPDDDSGSWWEQFAAFMSMDDAHDDIYGGSDGSV